MSGEKLEIKKPDEHVLNLLPGYVLGCLDDDDLIIVARHLSICKDCLKVLYEYQETINQLTLSGPLLDPPKALKNKVMMEIRNRADISAHSRPVSIWENFIKSIQTWFANPIGLALGGAVFVLIMILGINSFFFKPQNNLLQTNLPGDHLRLVQLTAPQDTPRTVGYLMVFKKEVYGTLIVEDAPLLDSHHQYQLWLIADGKRTSGGVFSVNSSGYGVLDVSASRPLEEFEAVGITIEPNGGSSGPTGKKVLGGNL